MVNGKPRTYNDIYFAARKTLRDAGIESAALEARCIVEKAAGKSREEFMRDTNLYVNADYIEKVGEMLRRRPAQEPAAYILGEWSFYGLPMNITPDVLIPRMDTELLAEKAIELLKGRDQETRVLDLCCGSGCVGIAIGVNVPLARTVYVDNSPKAMAVCRSNLIRNALTRSASYMEADALAAPPMLMGKFDMIVCNPPYIPTGDLARLDVSVKDYEPLSALDGGRDGLDFYRAVTENWTPILRSGGALLYECGVGQAADVASIMKQHGLVAVTTYKDTLGIDRVVAGIKTGGQDYGSEN